MLEEKVIEEFAIQQLRKMQEVAETSTFIERPTWIRVVMGEGEMRFCELNTDSMRPEGFTGEVLIVNLTDD